MTQANQADFFGEGLADPAQAAPLTPDQILEEKRRRKEWLANQGLDENGNPLPAYGTAASPTAGQYQVTTDGGPTSHSYSAQTGMSLGNRNLAPVVSVQRGALSNGAFTPGADMTAALSNRASAQLDVGNTLAGEAVNATPTVPGDKQVNVANRDALTPVIDPALERNKEVDRAFAMSQDLYNRVLNAPSQVKLAGDAALSNQLALARSARGGPGAVQEALGQAQQQAPGLLAQTQQAAIAEEQQRNQAAQGALGIYSAVAGNVADRATAIAQANQGAGLHVLDNLTTLTGQEMQFDANQTAVIGQLARDYMNNAAQFANMSVQLQIAQWQDITQRYGIDKTFDAVVKQIAAKQNVGPLDALKLLLGGASALPGIVKMLA